MLFIWRLFLLNLCDQQRYSSLSSFNWHYCNHRPNIPVEQVLAIVGQFSL